MRLLLISEYDGVGGGESFLLNTARGLAFQGHDVTVLVPEPGDLSRRLSENNIDVVFLKIRLRNVYRFWSVLKEHCFDSVVFNGTYSLYRFGFVTRMLHNVSKNIWVCHGPWVVVNFLRRWLLKYLADKVLVPNSEVKDFLLDNDVSLSIEVINLPIIINDFAYKLRNGPRTITVAMLARFQRVKGHDVFVRAIHELGETDDFTFIVAGDDPFKTEEAQQFKDYVHKLANELRVTSKVNFIGEVKDVAGFLRKVDILVVPSRYESYGMVILEGMAAGCTIIAADTDGPRKLVNNGKYGLLFPVEDHKGLARLIDFSRSNTQELEQVRDRALKHVTDNFNSENYPWTSILAVPEITSR
ncbi:glycosyltransferase family 4 protein [Alicyclobacillus curvatus]|nr:glycosyltransferase family 4 protein [Alicyclobacillus curvatus]